MPKPVPFGHVLGFAPGGIPACSSDYDSISSYRSRDSFMSIVAGHYCGFKYQCVEFSRRWLILARGVTYPDVHMAYEIFDIPYFINLVKGKKSRKTAHREHGAYDDDDDAEKVPVKRIPNGGSELPVQGSLMIWHEGGFFRHTGHVAVVTEATEEYVRVAEQNVTDAPWSGKDHARELKVTVKTDANGKKSYIVEERLRARVLGWVTPLFDDRHMPLMTPDEIFVESLDEEQRLTVPASVPSRV